MKTISVWFSACLCVILLGFIGQGCTPGKLPKTGVTHAVTAADRAALAGAFINEVGRGDQAWGSKELGVYKGYQTHFLRNYAPCAVGDDLTEELNEWPLESVLVSACALDSFTLDMFDEKDGVRYLRSTVVVKPITPTYPGATEAIQTEATIVDERDGPPLKAGSKYILISEIKGRAIPGMTVYDTLIRRLEDGTNLTFNFGLGPSYDYTILYHSGSHVTFDTACREATFTATVGGGPQGLPDGTVTPHGGPICLPADEDNGGPIPGTFDVDISGTTTIAQVDFTNSFGSINFTFDLANTIGTDIIEIHLTMEMTSSGPPTIDGHLALGGDRIVNPIEDPPDHPATGSLSLILEFPGGGGMPKSYLKFYTDPIPGMPYTLASTQQVETLLGAVMMMEIGDENNDDDGDGIEDNIDNCLNVFNPGQENNDNDWEGDACDWDDDNDNLDDMQESVWGTNPINPDTDNDLLSDGAEVHGWYGPSTNPTNPDSDSDTLKDGIEVFMGADPLSSDSDWDGVPDGTDNCPAKGHPNPDQADADVDGLGDVCDPSPGNPAGDFDLDGLTDVNEVFLYGTDPWNADMDGDGLNDALEIANYTNPRDKDSDRDQLEDGEEVLTYITNPNNWDTDGDRAEDGWEVQRGTDPNDPNSRP